MSNEAPASNATGVAIRVRRAPPASASGAKSSPTVKRDGPPSEYSTWNLGTSPIVAPLLGSKPRRRPVGSTAVISTVELVATLIDGTSAIRVGSVPGPTERAAPSRSNARGVRATDRGRGTGSAGGGGSLAV